MNYLICTHNTGAFIDMPAEATSDDYGNVQKEFAQQFGNGDEFASMVRLHPNDHIGGVRYDWGLAGPDGAWYVVYQFPENTDEQVLATVEKLKRDQDVVRLAVKRLKLVDFNVFQII
jgi:hypothetical protein